MSFSTIVKNQLNNELSEIQVFAGRKTLTLFSLQYYDAQLTWCKQFEVKQRIERYCNTGLVPKMIKCPKTNRRIRVFKLNDLVSKNYLPLKGKVPSSAIVKQLFEDKMVVYVKESYVKKLKLI